MLQTQHYHKSHDLSNHLSKHSLLPNHCDREVLKATYPDSNGNMDSSMMVNGQLLIGALVMWGFIYIAIFKVR